MTKPIKKIEEFNEFVSRDDHEKEIQQEAFYVYKHSGLPTGLKPGKWLTEATNLLGPGWINDPAKVKSWNKIQEGQEASKDGMRIKNELKESFKHAFNLTDEEASIAAGLEDNKLVEAILHPDETPDFWDQIKNFKD